MSASRKEHSVERRDACPTDTQHVVNLSGYVWAAGYLHDGELRELVHRAGGERRSERR